MWNLLGKTKNTLAIIKVEQEEQKGIEALA